jgi:hypothetical protein
MLTRIGIGNVLDGTDECGSWTFFEPSDEPFPDASPLLLSLLDHLDCIVGTVVLLHLDFSSTGGGFRLSLCLCSDEVVFTEREARDPSRELLKSRKEVTPSEVD